MISISTTWAIKMWLISMFFDETVTLPYQTITITAYVHLIWVWSEKIRQDSTNKSQVILSKNEGVMAIFSEFWFNFELGKSMSRLYF